MTDFNWKTIYSGDWNTAAFWSPSGGPPDSVTASATLVGNSSYYVTIGYESETVDGLLLNDAGATLELNYGGLLDLAGAGATIALSAGTIDLAGGTIAGGTLAETGGTFVAAGGTLESVTVIGTFAPFTTNTPNNDSLYIVGGLTATGAVIDLEGTYGDVLYAVGQQTFDHETINIGDGSHYIENYYTSDNEEQDEIYADSSQQTLTLGAGLTLDELAQSIVELGGYTAANLGIINAAGLYFDVSLQSFVNGGTINESGTLDEETTSFVNAGLISLGNTAALIEANYYYYSSTFFNTGSIVAGTNDLVEIAASGTNFSNTGTIILGSGDTLDIRGSLGIAQLARISESAGTLTVDGTLDLGGGTLLVGPTGLTSHVILDGALADGTIAVAGGSLQINSGSTLEYMSVVGTFAPFTTNSPNNDDLYIVGGLTATGAVIDLEGTYGDVLYALGQQTFDHETINIGGGSNYIENYYTSDNEEQDEIYADSSQQTLTLGAGLTLDELAQSIVELGGYTAANLGIINAAGLYFDVSLQSFVNAGTINESGTLDEETTSFVNAGLISLGNTAALIEANYYYYSSTFFNTGSIVAGTNDLVEIAASGTNFSNTGTIILGSGDTLDIRGSLGIAQLARISESAGTLTVDGTLDLGGGTLLVGPTGLTSHVILDGALADGTIAVAGGSLQINSGSTLEYMSVVGTFAPFTTNSPNNDDLYIVGGLTATGAVIDLEGTYGDVLYALGQQTFDHETINIGGGSNYIENYYTSDNEEQDEIYADSSQQTLTLGAGLTLDELAQSIVELGGYTAANLGIINAAGLYFDVSLQSFVNAGTINESGTLDEETTSFVNAGLISLGNTAALIEANYYYYSSTFFNTGSIVAGTNDLVEIAASGTNFSNTGTIILGSGDTLDIRGSLGIAQLARISESAGTLTVDGTLDLGGGTLLVGPTGLTSHVILDGALADGTIAVAGGSLQINSGSTLEYMSVVGTFAPFTTNSPNNDDLYIVGGLMATGAVINLEGTYGDVLYALGQQTFDQETINIGGGSHYIENYYTSDNEYQDEIYADSSQQTLTLGAGLTLDELAQSIVELGGYTAVNLGLIEANGLFFDITLSSFANYGTISASGSGTHQVDFSGHSPNLQSDVLIGGTYVANAGATLAIDQVGTAFLIVQDEADIVLNGTGAEITTDYNNVFYTLEDALSQVGPGGSLALEGGRSFTSIADLELTTGTLDLANGTLSATGLDADGTSLIFGNGTIAIGITSDGRITADGGTLDIAGSVSGAGQMAIDAGATLRLGGVSAEPVVFNGPTAELRLDDPADFTGTVGSLAVGDTVAFTGLVLSSATLVGSTLEVLAPGTSYAIALSNLQTPSLDRAAVSGDEVIVYREAEPNTVVPATVTLANQHAAGPLNPSSALVQGLTLANTAPTDGYSEFLDAGIGTIGGAIGSGTISLLAAGATSNAGLLLGVSDATGGSISGTGVISLYSDGSTLDGLGPLLLGTQDVSVSGLVYNYATATTIAPNPIAFTNHHVGDAVSSTLALTNSAAPTYSEALDANPTASASGIVVAGSIAGLGAGQTSHALTVSEITNQAGSASGSFVVGLTSDGTGIDGLGLTALPSQTVSAGGSVFAYANPVLASSTLTLANQHVGDAVLDALTLSNLGTNDAYTEQLDAGFGGITGAAQTNNATSTISAGGTDASSLLVGVTTGHAGTLTGQAVVTLISDGSTIDGLGTTALASQTVKVSGAVYAYADAILPAGTLTLTNTHVGQVGNAAVTLTNQTTLAAYTENLDASFGSTSGITGSGSLVIAPGTTNTTGLSVGGSSATAGSFGGTAELSLVSDGNGIDGLGTTDLASQTLTVSGGAFAYADPVIGTLSYTLAAHHVGDTDASAVAISNTATNDAFTENLLASWTMPTAGVAATGNATIAAGGSLSSPAFAIGLTAGSDGSFTGDATLDLVSDGSTIDGLGTTVLTPQVIDVSGNVYAYASLGLAPTSFTLGAARIGDPTLSQTIAIANGASFDPYQENLIFMSDPAPSGYGEIGLAGSLASGGTAIGTLELLTSSSGNFSGETIVVGATSDGTAIDGLGTTMLVGQTLTLSGMVYAAATAAIGASTIDLGIVHVGDVPVGTLAVGNLASGALDDSLIGTFDAASGGFTANGSLSVVAGQTGTLTIGLGTQTSGVYGGTVDLSLASHDPSLSDLSLGSTLITLNGTVDAYATAAYAELDGGGTFTTQGNNAFLDFGTVLGNSGSQVFDFAVDNTAAGLADLLSGTFTSAGAGAFTLGGFGSFDSVGAGGSADVGSVTLDTSVAGMFTETITLDALGSNGSGYQGALQPEVLTITGNVACYVAGTMILTPEGERAVETLSIGDEVVTVSGEARPIRWIGRRSYGRQFVRRHLHLQPIRIRAHALGDQLPHRDLLISPNHAMYLRGVLVPARDLLNGVTIIRDRGEADVRYFHLELDSHDVVLAEGAPSETFIDDESRGIFHNADDGLAPVSNGTARYYAPRVEQGELLEAIRSEMEERAA